MLDRSKATYRLAIMLCVVQLLILLVQFINSGTIARQREKIEVLSGKLLEIQEEQKHQSKRMQELTKKLVDGASAEL